MLTPDDVARIRERWTGNRARDLRGIPIADLDEADAEHNRESSRRYEKAERNAKRA